MSATEYDFLFKAIVTGDGGVGKTALTIRFTKGFFEQDYKLTIGVDFHIKTIEIQTLEGIKKCKLQLWDTGGQERFSSVRPMYYRGALGALLVFDLTNIESFEHLPNWIEEIKSNSKSDIPMLLIGNKSDLINERAVSESDIELFSQKFKFYYLETSAKSGENVSDCFAILAYLMMGLEVPQELLGQKELLKPGIIAMHPKSIPEPEPVFSAPSVPEPEPEPAFSAPPVPEPEPEPAFSAPPVPEPEPEPAFSAPPVPEPAIKMSPTQEIPKDAISPAAFEQETFTPKGVPFSEKTPKPVPPPPGFQPISPAPKPPKQDESEQLIPKSESPKAENYKPILFSELEPSKSPSLTQYLPQENSSKGDFFQTLSEASKKKGEIEGAPESIGNFIPFMSEKKEPSTPISDATLRVIPNAEEIKKKHKEKKKSKEKEKKSEKEKVRKKEMIICQHCGAVLSKAYKFCNRCGAKL